MAGTKLRELMCTTCYRILEQQIALGARKQSAVGQRALITGHEEGQRGHRGVVGLVTLLTTDLSPNCLMPEKRRADLKLPSRLNRTFAFFQ